jgi:hypothetical protein
MQGHTIFEFKYKQNKTPLFGALIFYERLSDQQDLTSVILKR